MTGDDVGSIDGNEVIRNGQSRPLSQVQQQDQAFPNMTPQGWDAFFGVSSGTPRSDKWFAQHKELVAIHQQVLRLLKKLQQAKNPALQKALLEALKSNVDVARTKQTELGLDDRVGKSIEKFAERWQKARPDSPLLAGLIDFATNPRTQIAVTIIVAAPFGYAAYAAGGVSGLVTFVVEEAVEEAVSAATGAPVSLSDGVAIIKGTHRAPGIAEDAAQQGRRLTGAAAKGRLRTRLGSPPSSMTRSQAHHDLPQSQRFRDHWDRAGLDIDDPSFGRWVEGGPVGNHQKWSAAFNREWDDFFKDNPFATREEVLEHMNRLRNDPRFQ